MEERDINFLNEEQIRQSLQEEANRRRKRRWLFIIAGILFIGGCVTSTFGRGGASNDPLAYNPVTLERKKPAGLFSFLKQVVLTKDTTLKGEKDDRINILLLGIGGPGHDGPYLTDTIILGSVKPSTRQIALISIPRDLEVKMPSYGLQKINRINSFGEETNPGRGGELTGSVIGDLFDIDIPYYIRLDFRAFAEIIDDIGGIKVNVERSFDDHTYPTEDRGYQTVSFQRGIQTMDGAAALIYARSRHGSNGEGSDFARAKRQQKMLLALKEKVLSFSTLANPVRLSGILGSLRNHLSTNMEFSEMMTLLRLGKELKTDRIATLVLDNSPAGLLKEGYSQNNGFILTPESENWDEINTAIVRVFDGIHITERNDTPPQAAPKISPASIEIQNGTWAAGLAARMKKRLEDKSFVVATIGNTTERPEPSSGIYILSSKNTPSEVASALQEELHLAIKQTPPRGIAYAASSDILVILGEDFTE